MQTPINHTPGFGRGRRALAISGAAATTVDELAPVASYTPRARRPAHVERLTLRVRLEGLLYIVLGVLAALTRLWDLSSRAEHHDESLHAYFSWLYYVGDGYIHDPLMHGPSLFHSNALAYFLFGDNDYTSRLVPALLGIVLVLMPYLLRGPQLLGRWGALACSTLLLFSPTMLYQQRYIRHDPIMLVCTLGIVIGCLRYLERPARRWVVLVGVLSGLLFATMEVSFIIAFVLVTFVAGIVTWQLGKRVFGIMILTGIGLLAVWKIMPALGAGPLPAIPWENPTNANIRAFSIDLVQHPIVLASIGVLLLGLIGALGALERVRDSQERGWLDGLLKRAPRQSTSHAVYQVLKDRRSLGIGVAGGLAVFVALYTSLFTNMPGLASGTAGALGYWLGQHDVQRADQPWFYYMLMLPQYEFVAMLLFPVGVALTAWRLIPRLRRGRPVGRRTYLRAFAIYWAMVNLAIFSWAGEKMPWLTVHMALPLIVLASSVIGAGIERVEALARAGQLPKGAAVATALGVPLVTAGWYFLWAWGSAGPWVMHNNDLVRAMRPSVADHPWVLYLPLLALLGLLAYAVLRMGRQAAALVAGTSCVLMLLFAQMHVGYHLAYQDGDTPKDMMIYVQTSPDVTRVVEEIGVLSRELTGGLDMPIYYDAGTSWPFQWYLRNYTQRRYFGTTLNEPPDAPIVLISNEQLSTQNQDMLAGYTYVEYAMRWWFPEDETYRRFAIAPELHKAERQNYQTSQQGPFTVADVAASVWRSLWGMHEPAEQAKMFRLVAFRELWAPIGSYNFRVYVRNDLLQTYNDIRY